MIDEHSEKYAGMSEPNLLNALGTDATKWADAFCEMHGGDRGLMTTWFANAMMNEHDTLKGRARMIDEHGEIHAFHRRSESCAAIFQALAKAQEKFAHAEKAGDNTHFRSKYVTLESVLEASREGRAENGLAIVQMPGNAGGNIAVTTIIGHSSGEWIESTLYVAPAKFDAQSAGSVITYLRRYALLSILGIAPEDDDGEAAVARPSEKPSGARTASKAYPVVAKAGPEVSFAREAYKRLRGLIDDDAYPARRLYDPDNDEWGEWASEDIDLIAKVSPASLDDLKARVADKLAGQR
jgi:hypothetical protein